MPCTEPSRTKPARMAHVNPYEHLADYALSEFAADAAHELAEIEKSPVAQQQYPPEKLADLLSACCRALRNSQRHPIPQTLSGMLRGLLTERR